jgi:glycerate dehydrogenase
MRAVFLDGEGLDDLDLSGLAQACGTLEVYHNTEPDQTAARIAGAEIVLVNKVQLDRRHLDAAPGLKLIAEVSTGTDNIDLEAARQRGVTVCNCRAYGVASVVQHVFAAILALATNLLPYTRAVRAGRWQQSDNFCLLDYPIREIRGKTLGIVGYGNLGRGVAEIARAFAMRVVLARRPGGPPDDRPLLAEMLPQVDVLSLHCPLTEQTRHLIDRRALALMRPDALLINCARGGLVDETALVEALQSGRLAGAAVDVLSIEPPRDGNPLLAANLPNLLITPHCAWASREARETIIAQTTENILAFQAGTPLRRVGGEDGQPTPAKG